MQVMSKLSDVEGKLCCNWIKYSKELPDLMKYKQCDLKYICKKNQLRVAGNKSMLVDRIQQKYKIEHAACLIQTISRRYIAKKYISLHGPAYKDRQCTNDTDFYTLEPLSSLHIKDFFSFKDKCGFIFGFDLNSINSLMRRNKQSTNPYNRNKFPNNVIRDVKRLRILNRIHYPKKISINPVIVNVIETPIALTRLERIRTNKTFTERVINLFYEIDQIGNYTSYEWMSMLNRDKLVQFTRFIYQLWNYQAGMSQETKRNICPYFDPFEYQRISANFTNDMDLERVQQIAITICENMFHTSIDVEYKKLSAICILTALTTVSNDARHNIPWLYESTL